MPRRLTVAPHLPIADLEQRYRAAHAPVARSHWHILWLLARGDRSERVADVTGYSVKWVREVAARYTRDGPDAIGDQRHRLPGRADRRLLTPALAAELTSALIGPAPDGGLWTSRTVAGWMSERLGRPVAVQRGWEAIRAVGFTPQRPRPRAVTADPVAQAAFKKGGSRPRSMPSTPPIPTR